MRTPKKGRGDLRNMHVLCLYKWGTRRANGVKKKQDKNTHQQSACKIIKCNNLHACYLRVFCLQPTCERLYITHTSCESAKKGQESVCEWMSACVFFLKLFIVYFQTTVILGIEVILLRKFVQVVARDSYIFLHLLIIIIFQ